MRTTLLLSMLAAASCAASPHFELQLSAPTIQVLTTETGAHAIGGDVAHGDARLEFFYVASTQDDDAAPTRLSMLTPFNDATIGDGDEHAHVFFHSPGAACSENGWLGSITWLQPMPEYEVAIDARCIDSDAQLVGVLRGNL